VGWRRAQKRRYEGAAFHGRNNITTNFLHLSRILMVN